ncbi:hypothetical protein ACFV0O_34285 [Kitasatospora sp. NPDC059577]|uniref:hypothetical protein n=1 Tax=unclassified Kitasatospora TaxID=2633591 RepID=UPI0036962DFD
METETWDDLTVTEQVLMRRAVSGHRLAGAPQHVAAVLRWAGSPDVAALRGATVEEQRARVPELAAATVRLVGAGWLTVHRGRPMVQSDDDPAVSGPELEQVVADPATWLHGPVGETVLTVRASDGGLARWEVRAYPPGGRDAPVRERFSGAEEAVLVCAMEASGWLTGPFGIFADLPPELTGDERRAFVEEETAPLARFVGDGSIEVHHVARPDSADFTVVPLDDLVEAFCDRELRCDDSDEWGIGFTCVLTQSPATALR